ncbi:hypothetical protein BST61_g9247 [Cercospora zeina]
MGEISGHSIHRLIDNAWETVLSQSGDARLKVEELLQVLTIAYELPTMADLAVLTGIDDLPRLSTLIQLCTPIIELGFSGELQGKIIQTSVKVLTSRERLANVATKLVRSATVNVRVNDGNVLEVTNDGDDVQSAGKSISSSTAQTCPYPIKYLFKPLSEGFPDVAHDLYEDDPDFWGQSSNLRSAWLREYQILTTDFKDLDTRGMSALHIAAGIGAKELVSILVGKNGKSALSWKSEDGMTAPRQRPLFGYSSNFPTRTQTTRWRRQFCPLLEKWNSISELLDHVIRDNNSGHSWSFKVDDAFYLAATTREENLDILNKLWYFSRQRIPTNIRDFSLYQATVMKKDATVIWLLETCKANANATADRPELADSATAVPIADYSTALNAAASSGMTDLVKSLLGKGANIDGDSGYALHLAASQGHEKVVQILLEHGASVDQEVPNSEDIGFFSSTALQAACENNKIEVIKILLAHGANPNLGGGPSSNPITTATERGLPEVLKLLLQTPETTQQEKCALQDQNVALEEHAKELKDALAAVHAAAQKATPGPTPTSEPAPQLPQRVAPEDYFQVVPGEAIPHRLDTGSDTTEAVPPIPNNSATATGEFSPPAIGSSPPLPPRQQLSPLGSPRTPGQNGFRTIHGTHRPDGS